MNEEEGDAMRMLDARLARLHAGLDTRPGFEERLAARIATLPARQAPAARSAEQLRIERSYREERAAADRDARIETAVVGVAGVAAAGVAWHFAPLAGRLLEALVAGTQAAAANPLLLGAASLAVAGAALWGALRVMQVDPRSLIGA